MKPTAEVPEDPALHRPLTPPDAAPAGLGRAMGSGASSMVISSVLSKGAMMAAQVILGWLLSQDDFGVYASAMGLSSIVAAFKDGGARELLIQRGEGEYASLSGPVFWLALAMNSAVGLMMAAIAWPAAAAYGDPRIAPILLIIAASVPLSTPSSILQSRLRMDLRFAELARLNTVSALIRQVGSVLLAILGFGPISFILPLLVCTIFENLYCIAKTRDRPWTRAAGLDRWPELFRAGKWLIAGSLACIILDQGSFAALGLIVSKAVVGSVYFAFMAMMQTAVLLSYAVQLVLMPVLARLRDDPERHRSAVVRSFRATLLLAGGACVTLAAVMSPLESLVWRGRWENAVLAVQLFGIFFAMRCTFGPTTSVLQGAGGFKRWSLYTLLEGLVLVGGALLGAVLGGYEGGVLSPHGGWGGPTDIALWSAAALGATRFIISANVLARCGCPLRQRLAVLLPAWLLGCAALIASALLDLALFGTGAAAGMVKALGAAGLGRFSAGPWPFLGMEAVRLVALGVVCTGVYAALVRIFLAGDLKDAVGVAPSRLRAPFRRLFLLPAMQA